MLRLSRRPVAFLSLMLAVCVVAPAAAQGRRRGGARPQSAKPDATAAAPQGADSLNSLKFRNLGPSVGGGRVTAVTGIPGDPNTYYVGAAAGGVWKTADGGNSWDAVFADQPAASTGAVALAPSNPNLVWVGSGEANLRNDLVDGRGVFFSPDAGKTWQFKGLSDVGQISRIVVDPTNPDIVLVAAIGHAWAPNPERGVFRTADGGKTWQKVLFANDTTGVSDLVMVPGNPACCSPRCGRRCAIPGSSSPAARGAGSTAPRTAASRGTSSRRACRRASSGGSRWPWARRIRATCMR